MEAMPCHNQRLGAAGGPRPQDEQTAPAGGCSRLIRFAEPSEGSGSGSPSPDSSSASNGAAAVPSPAAEECASPLGAQLKLLPMNDQIRELQTIIRDK